MTPREFLETVVRPNVADFHQEYGSIRHAYNAVAAVDALAAHIFVWCKAHATDEVDGIKDDSAYRAVLAQKNSEFRLLRDTAKAQKHVHLEQGKPEVSKAAQINVRPGGYGIGPYGAGQYGGPPQVVVDTDAGGFSFLEKTVDEALAFLEAEMTRLDI